MDISFFYSFLLLWSCGGKTSHPYFHITLSQPFIDFCVYLTLGRKTVCTLNTLIVHCRLCQTELLQKKKLKKKKKKLKKKMICGRTADIQSFDTPLTTFTVILGKKKIQQVHWRPCVYVCRFILLWLSLFYYYVICYEIETGWGKNTL